MLKEQEFTEFPEPPPAGCWLPLFFLLIAVGGILALEGNVPAGCTLAFPGIILAVVAITWNKSRK